MVSLEPEDGQLRRWFRADDLWLSIDRPVDGFDPEVATLHDAILLDEHAPLLNILAAWLDHSHDWAPADADFEPELVLTLRSEQYPDLQIQLGLEDATEQRWPEFPAELAAMVEVNWHYQPTRLRLQCHVLSEADLERLDDGSLMLLDGSFDNSWPVSLVFDQDTPLEFDAMLDTATGEVRLGSSYPSNRTSQDKPHCDVYLAEVVLANLARLDAGLGSPGDWLHSIDALAGARVELVLQTETPRGFDGELVSMGSGFGALLQVRQPGHLFQSVPL